MTRVHYLLRDLGGRLRHLSTGERCPGRILVVDEEGPLYGEPLSASLPECQFTFSTCPQAAKRIFLSAPTDLVILNHSPTISCLNLLPAFKSFRPSVSVIVVTGHGSEELAVQAFRHGAIDYFRKPLALNELELCIRAVLELRRTSREKIRPQAVSGLQRAFRYIEGHFQVQLRLEQAAREAGMSISCFERHLRQKTGMTFTSYVNTLRVSKAKEMIQADHTSLLQVALASGFGNQSHFNRVFRKLTGVTPGEYREGATSHG